MKVFYKGQEIKEDYLFLDFETRSYANIKEVGTLNYALDPSTSVICASYAINDGKIKSVVYPKSLKDFPKEVRDFKGLVVPFYYPFEHSITKHVLAKGKNHHLTDAKNYYDSMAVANRWGHYGGLGAIAHSLGVGEKLAEGKGLINKYSKPDRNGKLLPITEEDLEKFVLYCEKDVKITREIFNLLDPLDKEEYRLYLIDVLWNTTGLNVDYPSLNKLLISYEKQLEKFEKQAEKLLGRNDRGALNVSSNSSFLKSLSKLGVEVPNVQAKTLDLVYSKLGNTAKDKKVKEILDLRTIINSKAPKKLFTFKDLGSDCKAINGRNEHRLFHFLQYYGAHTGRWAGRGVQIQNISRNAVSDKDYKATLEKFCSGKVELKDFKNTLTSLLRGLIIPTKGKKFLIGDLSAIEARVNFWLAGCKKGLEAYRKGIDIYSDFASVLPLKHIKDPKARRQIGKRSILGLGYGMGNKKFMFELEAEKVSPDLIEELSIVTVKTYRKTYPEIPALWRGLETAWVKALRDGKASYRLINFRTVKKGKILYMRVELPSGRELSYPFPTENTYVGREGRKEIWGGVLCENVVQATARDILRFQIFKMEELGFELKSTEHDSILCESPNLVAKKDFVVFNSVMNSAPKWAKDCPIAAECAIVERYGK